MLRDSTKYAGYFVSSIFNVFAIRRQRGSSGAGTTLARAAPPTCQVGGPPPDGGLYKWELRGMPKGALSPGVEGGRGAVQLILRTLPVTLKE
jgi:hypothetical protein